MADIDLSALAISIIILGIVTSIGATILTGIRDSVTVASYNAINASTTNPVNGTGGTTTVGPAGCQSVFACFNSSTVEGGGSTNRTLIEAGNYTATASTTTGGRCSLTYVGPAAGGIQSNSTNGTVWVCSYTANNVSQEDYALANDAAIGLGEYGNWFNILVIVGIAAVILGLIFYAFQPGRSGGDTGGADSSY